MARQLGQPMVVDNKPSAGSIVGSAAVAQAAPDGHTLLLMSNANAVSASLFRKLPFDVLKDFAPVGTLGVFDLALFVAAEFALQELARVAGRGQGQPGQADVGTIAVGSTQHLSAELFETAPGVDVLVVPYKGTPAVLTALRAGEIDAAFEILGPDAAAGAGQAWCARWPSRPTSASRRCPRCRPCSRPAWPTTTWRRGTRWPRRQARRRR